MPSLRPALISLLLVLAGCGGGGAAPPPIVNNDQATTNEGVPVTIDVLANDANVAAGTLTRASAPAHGSVALSGGVFIYTPAAGFAGHDSFTYTVTGTNGTAATATVSIDVNAPPVAVNDNFSVVINTPTTLSILANDSDSDGTLTGGIVIVTPPAGTLSVNTGDVRYTPPGDFTGADSFTYQVKDNQGAASNTATVSISVVPITQTSISVQTLTVPQTGYSYVNNTQLNATLLSSPMQTLSIPPNTVSFLLMLRGSSVNPQGGLFISRIVEPDGTSPPYIDAVQCDVDLCTVDVPKLPGISAVAGNWQFQLATQNSSTTNINFAATTLQVTTRVGPLPNASATYPATIDVHPVLTATSVSATQFQPVLTALVQLAAANAVNLVMDPLTVVTDPQYTDVSTDFNDATTAALVGMGDPDKVNLFFVESFTGPQGGGTIGVAAGIPGTLGVQDNLNGVMINATATFGSAYYDRTTAEFALHEMGHLLGLYHTTESDFSAHDILADTPECTPADDTNHNGIADVSECPDGLNLMFWTNDFALVKDPLSNDQRQVLFYSVIATP